MSHSSISGDVGWGSHMVIMRFDGFEFYCKTPLEAIRIIRWIRHYERYRRWR